MEYTNQRKTNTKDKVHSTLIKLLHEKKVSEISVTELCKKANINRTSFYNHYNTIQDVFEETIQEYIEKTALFAKTKLEQKENFKQWLTDVLEYIKKNILLSKFLTNINIENLLQDLNKQLPDFSKYIYQKDGLYDWKKDYKKKLLNQEH